MLTPTWCGCLPDQYHFPGSAHDSLMSTVCLASTNLSQVADWTILLPWPPPIATEPGLLLSWLLPLGSAVESAWSASSRAVLLH